METIYYLILGLIAGVFSGMIGIGGGLVIIPTLVLFFGMGQHMAQGTTLALMVPPIGLLAAWTYYREGFVNFKAAGLICLAFFFGGLFGAQIATHLPTAIIKRIFGVVLLLISFKMILGK